ncbi:hypothetical protein RN001_011033 [Aquatica leii]|uniref:Uncharacterized protein n=1 Tax=Aquatica leii TaxID=1421715 RepID=A0AAN7PXA0_9COLE|nr:hypothetical protein RN001_011033 [Aquatica leii]
MANPHGFDLVPRDVWGARAPKSPEVMKNPVPYVIIHHTYQPGACNTTEECIKAMKSMQDFHQLERNWSDIGYNFAVGGDGKAYVGRGWSLVGAHSPTYNDKSIGICLIGDWRYELPDNKLLDTVHKLIEYGVQIGKIAPNYLLFGHKQVREGTECPGDKLFQEISLWKHFSSTPPTVWSPNKNSKCCREIEETKVKVPPTAESLSWRRLHMSRAKLKATSTTSELLSGFAMIAMVELQINEGTAVPEWLFVMFSVCTTVLVAVHIFALMISTYILPNIDAISKLDVSELVSESPHERMKGFIQLACAFSTVLGLFLFLVEVAILCWVKFWDYSFTAAIAATVIVTPVLIIFVLFAVHFYHSLVVHRCDTSVTDLEKLEDMKKHLDEASSPV